MNSAWLEEAGLPSCLHQENVSEQDCSQFLQPLEVIQSQELSLEDPDGAVEWDRFVGQDPWGTAFHTSAWLDVLQKEGFEVLPLTFKKERNVVAVAPFCLLLRFQGLVRVAVSFPQSDVGGPLVDPAMPESAFAPILARSLRRLLAKRVVSCSATGPGEPLRAMPGKPRPLRGVHPIIKRARSVASLLQRPTTALRLLTWSV